MWESLASNLPHLSAALNLTATVLLVLGLISIRRGQGSASSKDDACSAGGQCALLTRLLVPQIVAPDGFRKMEQQFSGRSECRAHRGPLHLLWNFDYPPDASNHCPRIGDSCRLFGDEGADS